MFLAGEPEAYAAVDKLYAIGYFPGFLANTRPYSVKGVRKEVEKLPRMLVPDKFARDLAGWLDTQVRPKLWGRVSISGAYSPSDYYPPNQYGVLFPRGVSAQGALQAREETTKNVSAHASGVYWVGEGNEDDGRVLDTALEVGTEGMSIQGGVISAWYGPGRHGALIFSNNASSFPGARLYNPVPIEVPGFFSFLGSVQYDLFFGWLEGDRPIPHSQIMSLRLAARPSRFFEIGFTKAMHFGGDKEGVDLPEWTEFFRFRKDTSETGVNPNFLAGFDITLNLPFRAQPFQLYLEAAGEDQGAGSGIELPTKWAILTGFFLPSFAGSAKFDLRVEYASNHIGGKGEAWYVHGPSEEGYAHRYKGRILGHHMGTDAEDLYIAARYYFLPTTFLLLDYDYTKRYEGSPFQGRQYRFGGTLVTGLTEELRMEARIEQGNVKASKGVTEEDAPDGLFASFSLAVSF